MSNTIVICLLLGTPETLVSINFLISEKILILFAHPAFQKSRINRILIEGLNNIDGVTFPDLYQCYPELDIDVKQEQILLEDSEELMFQEEEDHHKENELGWKAAILI